MKNQSPPPGQLPQRATSLAPFRAPGGPGRVPYRGVDILDPLHLARPVGLKRPAANDAAVRKTPAQISHIYELGRTSAAMSFHEAALENMREVTSLAPDHEGAWRELTVLLRLAGRDEEADEAEAKSAALAGTETRWLDAHGERSPTRLDRLDDKLKERLEKIPDEKRLTYLRDQLFENPLDVVAMRYLSNFEEVEDDLTTAASLFVRAIALSPSYLTARIDYARLLMVQRNHSAAMRQSEYLVAHSPNNIRLRLLRADAAVHMERFDEAVALYEATLKQEPSNAHMLNSYANVLRTVGRREDSVRVFRTLLSVVPTSGTAYFGLSELKANHLTTEDVAAMRHHLARGIPELTTRKCMAYALGQTLERARDYEGSFEAYVLGAQACKEEVAGTTQAHDPVVFEERLDLRRTTFTADRMAAHPGRGSKVTTTPIFVVGMPRAGSTLVEQILASHSMVEGTRELPVIPNVVKKVAMSRVLVAPDVYPQRVADFNRAQLDALGEETLAGMAEYRRTTLPFVIDKRPWNWLDAPFIQLMLPQAKFIDIRRAPMSAGLAMFKQLLPSDAAFTFDLNHLGRYYRNYVGFMDYLDTIMPGSILRVSYEDLVNDTEIQIRRMLDHCGLPFEERCLRFWETDRAVFTPSAEQVRRPIFRDALTQWKNFGPWLGPLRESLGDLAEA